MRFLVDAQLPPRVARWLRANGHDAIHTKELPGGNETTDDELGELCIAESRIMVTKDRDFLDSFILLRRPRKLLLITMGNISNADLESILEPNFPAILAAFEIADFIEADRTTLIVHQ
jgi:predicted nuclease of predicted toxin-antitoxin system